MGCLMREFSKIKSDTRGNHRCRALYGEAPDFAVVELDHQLHYMRTLGSAMNVIDARVPLAQALTSRPIVEFMWSLAPESRTDEVLVCLA